MRKFSILLSLSVLAAMILTACGGAGTSTTIPTQNVPPVTAEVTGTSVSGTATEAATEAPTTGTPGTPGIPITGAANPARVSSQLTFAVQAKDGTQVGNVKDEVLDFDNTRVAYVVVDANGKQVLVPWSSLTLQTSTSEQGVFILNADQNTFNNAPTFDLSTLPQMGQSASGWDAQISSYWQNGGTGTGSATATAGTGTGGTSTGAATATAGAGTGSGTGTNSATATAGTGTGSGTGVATATASTGTGTGMGTGVLQGVALATDVLGSTVNLSTTGTGTGTGLATATSSAGGTGTGLATATSSAGTGSATSTPATGTGLATATAGTGTGSTGAMTVTIEDIIVDTSTGDMMYFALNTNSGNNQLIPVPLSIFGWDSSMQGFVLNTDATTLQNAPGFASDQFPDTTTSGWNSQFDTYWQSNGIGGTGTGTGTQATATATP